MDKTIYDKSNNEQRGVMMIFVNVLNVCTFLPNNWGMREGDRKRTKWRNERGWKMGGNDLKAKRGI